MVLILYFRPLLQLAAAVERLQTPMGRLVVLEVVAKVMGKRVALELLTKVTLEVGL
jgi:hypothetical protein